MKNFRKYLVITLTTFLVAVLTLGVTNPNDKRHHRRGYERPIRIEEWMTHPFIDTLEEPLEVEEWMTKPFNNIS